MKEQDQATAECLSKCQEFGFNEEITRETLWNEGYRLGRARWYWGPSWFVSLTGWFNTQKERLFGREDANEVGK